MHCNCIWSRCNHVRICCGSNSSLSNFLLRCFWKIPAFRIPNNFTATLFGMSLLTTMSANIVISFSSIFFPFSLLSICRACANRQVNHTIWLNLRFLRSLPLVMILANICIAWLKIERWSFSHNFTSILIEFWVKACQKNMNAKLTHIFMQQYDYSSIIFLCLNTSINFLKYDNQFILIKR